MAAKGSPLARHARSAVGQVVSFCECVLHEIIPAFGNLEKRAKKVADPEHHRLDSQLMRFSGSGVFWLEELCRPRAAPDRSQQRRGVTALQLTPRLVEAGFAFLIGDSPEISGKLNLKLYSVAILHLKNFSFQNIGVLCVRN